MNPLGKKIGVGIIAVLIIIVGTLAYRQFWPTGFRFHFGKTPSLTTKDITLLNQEITAEKKFSQIISQTPDPVGALTPLNHTSLASTFSAGDLKIIARPTHATVANYAKGLAVALRPLSVPHENELGIFLKAIENRDQSELIKLVEMERAYAMTINNLTALAVPASATEWHLRLLNALGTQHTLITTMQGAFVEPVAALQSASRYLTESRAVAIAVSNLNVYFKSNNVELSAANRLVVILPTVPR